MRLSNRNPVHRLRHLLATHDLDAQPDSVLLARFAAARDEAAFATLVHRHSPLVLGTARRVLGNLVDADDVLQAVFLTLARKAGTVRCEGTLGPWLYRVAFRAALRMRKQPRSMEPVADRAADATADPMAQMSARELCSAIDAEVARLSARLRAVVVLCCFQGLTRDEAAAQLGWSSATVKRRLARARDLLDRRLRARGIALPAALAPVLLAVSPPASADSISATIETALGRITPPGRVGALCGMASVPLKTWAAGAICISLVAVGLALGLRQSRPAPPAPVPEPTTPVKPDATAELPTDPLPAGAIARIGTTRFRHDEWLSRAAWSPDGRYLASAAGRTVIVWDAATGRELARKVLSDGVVTPAGDGRANLSIFMHTLGWAPDGTALATGVNDLTEVWAWDAATRRLADRPRVERVGLAPGGVQWSDAHRLVTAERSRLSVTDLGKQSSVATFELPDTPYDHMLAVPGSSQIAVATQTDRGRLLVFDWTHPDAKPRDLGVLPQRLAVSANGSTLAAVTGTDEGSFILEWWDTATWTSRGRIPYESERPCGVRALALSPDGKTLITGGSDKTLRWWNLATGKEVRREGPGWVYYNQAAFRPDGKVLLTVSHENHIRLWDVESGKPLPITDGPGWLIAAATFTPDGKQVLSVSENGVFAHDAGTGRALWRCAKHTDTAVQVVVTPDGRTAISSGNDGRIIFRETATGKVLRTIECPRHAVDRIAISPDGRTLAAIGGDAPDDAIVRRWDIATGKPYADAPLPPKGPKYLPSSIRYTPDGAGIVIASGTEIQVPVFDPERKVFRQTFGPADGGVNCADMTADGRMVAAATAGGSIFLWETATGQQRLMVKDIGYATCLAFSPDGRILAVANDGSHRLVTGDKTIEHTGGRLVVRVLDSLTGKEFHQFAGHTGSVYRLAWSSDGRRLLSTSNDASALVWDVSPAVRRQMPTAPLSGDDAAKAVANLAGTDGAAVYREMARLVAAPATGVSALRRVLSPVSSPDADVVAGLVRDLDSPQFAARERAAGQLARLDEGVEGPLRKALDGKLSAEARDRVEKVLAEVAPTDQRLRQGRALEVLERGGDKDARRLLAELANGADGAWLTREAKASLGRLTPPAR